MTRPVAVVCVTYNAGDHVGDMLGSVHRAISDREVPVIVIDNGSSDGTVELLRAASGIQVVEQTNVGYAGGLNRGIAEAPVGHDILALNPDVVLRPGAVDRLSAVFEERDDVAIAVPALFDTSGRLLPSLRRAPVWWRTLVEAFVGGSRAGRLGESFQPDLQGGLQDADWATGAAMLIRRDVFDEVGPWDQSFFLYSEETEFCLRVRDAGHRLVCEPQSAMMHVGGEMGRNARLWALRAVNRVRLQRRRSRPSAAALRAASVVFESRRALLGDAVSRAAIRALLSRDLEGVAVQLTRELGGDPARSG